MVADDRGLRERKRAQTRHRLEAAAVGLVLEHGLDRVTVEAISESADVSPRTFFNYFDSKEDAILGVRPAGISEEELERHRVRYQDADLVRSVLGLLFVVIGPSIADPTFRDARRQVVRRYPELLGHKMLGMARLTDELSAATQVLLLERRHAPAGPAVADGVVEILLMACGAAVRSTVRQWAATRTDLSLDDLERRAASLVTDALEILT